MTRWPDDQTKWPDDWIIKWPDIQMIGWHDNRMTGWHDYMMTWWPNEWMTRWPHDQMTGWHDDRMLRRRLTVWYISILYLFPLNEECAIISNVVSTIVKILQVFVHGSKHLLCYSADITSELWSARSHTIPSLYFTYFLIHFHHRIWDNIMMIKTFAAKAWPVFLNLRKTKVNWKDFFTIIFYLGLDIPF